MEANTQNHAAFAPLAERLGQVGRVVATEAKPNTAYEFHFWTAPGVPVGIGTLVVVLLEGLEVYGVVVEGWSWTDVASAMHDYIGMDGDPVAPTATLRPEIRCYTAAVLRRDPEEPVQPVPVGPVYLADDFCVRKALRMDTYYEKSGVAVGAYQNGDLLAPVYLDADFLLGPEAAHVNLTGVSGLATKTSAIEFLLQSIFASSVKGVACVCFNVKGHDLLFLDYPAQPPKGSNLDAMYGEHGIAGLTDADKALYDSLNVPFEPFQNVLYYAPYHENQLDLRTLRSHPAVEGSVQPLAWGLSDIVEFAEVVLSRDDVDPKADALLQYIRQRVLDPAGYHFPDGEGIRVHTFDDLERWFGKVMEYMEGKNDGRGQDQYRTHHIATIRKVHNRLSNLVARYKGLLVSDNQRSDLDWEGFSDRQVHVVDIAGLDAQGQDLVVTRIVTKLKERLESKTLGNVNKCVVIVDELNKYAPSEGPETYLKKTLLEISERGRYIGLVLFSAQQFRSQVHKRVVGNSGTSIYGRMDMDELATPGYQVLSRAEREKLATLAKGQLMVRHPHFSQAIFVKFPRPNVLRGADGVRVFPPAAGLTLAESAFLKLKDLDEKIQRARVEELVANADPASVMPACYKVRAKPEADILAQFEKLLRKPIIPKVVSKSQPLPSLTVDEIDPFQE